MEKVIKSIHEYSAFQHLCLKQEYDNRCKNYIKYEKEINKLLEYLKLKMSYYDF